MDFPKLRAGRRQQVARRRSATPVATVPAPVGGWNARDALTAMEPTDAIQLDNFIPSDGGVRLREGFADHATGVGSNYVESLFTYSPPSGTEALFATSPTAIYDVTAAGAGTSVVTGLTSGRWQHAMFATSSGNFLVLCNGADDVRNWDGSSWTAPSISNVASATLVNVAVHASRLWFVQSNTLDAWFLPVSAISGSATKLALGPFCNKGGYLVAAASWTRDGGAGMDDLMVFVTSKGQAVIYSGSDPSSASTWTKVGTFNIPEPIGRRCFVQIGADLGLITTQGVVPLSAILPLSSAGVSKVAATDKISGAFTEAAAGSATFQGWQLIELPKKGLLVVNVPLVERVTSHQYVMNTTTGAWCRFTGLNAGSWALKGGSLYFGGFDGTVRKYGGIFSDDGVEINGTAISAFTDLGRPNTKIFTMARPMLYAPDGYDPLLAIKTDYDLGEVEYSATSSVSLGSFWDDSEWDVAEWGLGIVVRNNWQSVRGIGSRVSVALAVAVTEEVRYNAVDLMFEPGGDL